MPIPFTCPHCGRQTTVADQYAGQTGPCGACGQPITIPPLEKPAASPWAAPADERQQGSSIGTAGIVVGVIAGSLIMLLVCGGILVALLLPAVQAAREAARRAQCSNNLRQIGLAFHGYHDAYGTFPPAYLTDEDGNPTHSWRVLLLPFLEHASLHQAYNFDQPWDSPANRAVVDRMIPVYACPSDPGAFESFTTNYMVITGPGTVFEGSEATAIREIRDGLSNTLLVVEVRDTGVHWAAPVDLDADNLVLPFQGGPRSPGSWHPGGVNVVMCDGSVRFLSETTAPEVFRSLTTKAGGEAVRVPEF